MFCSIDNHIINATYIFDTITNGKDLDDFDDADILNLLKHFKNAFTLKNKDDDLEKKL